MGNWLFIEALIATDTEHKMLYYREKVEEIADHLIKISIDNFKKRHGKVETMIPRYVIKVIARFSTKAILNALGDKLDLLV